LTSQKIPGWFNPLDESLFNFFLEAESHQGNRGNLLELGAYLGKSAVVIGTHLRKDEVFTVVDLFEAPAPKADNASENQQQYSSLTQRAFERNYLGHHATLPIVLRMTTAQAASHLVQGSYRFIHVDASHIYEHVAGDVEIARKAINRDGIAVFDDYRAAHTPGTAAAIWGAVAQKGLMPIVITPNKLYGTWGAATNWTNAVREHLSSQDYRYEIQEIKGQPVVRAWSDPARAPLATNLRDFIPPVATQGARKLRAWRRNRAW
jgi:hypothetical protein